MIVQQSCSKEPDENLVGKSRLFGFLNGRLGVKWKSSGRTLGLSARSGHNPCFPYEK